MKYCLLIAICYSCSFVEATQLIMGEALSCTDRITIVNHHNALRRKIAQGKVERQPKASNMNFLVWDDSLATLAQNYANKMIFMHNTDIKDSRFYVGQNLHMYATTSSTCNGFDWTAVISTWFNEHKSYRYGAKYSSFTGHYTQVVWAGSKYIGCGASYFKGNGKWFYSIFVCNYGPGGNSGPIPYSKGTGCENLCCPHCEDNNLYGNNNCAPRESSRTSYYSSKHTMRENTLQNYVCQILPINLKTTNG